VVDRLVNEPFDSRWVLDSGPLSHFSKAGWLGLLKHIGGSRQLLIPDVVYDELLAGAPAHPHLSLVLDATNDWLAVHPLDDIVGLAAFGRYTAALVGEDGRNTGECGVLALAETMPATAIIDDRAARSLAVSASVEHRGTVGLLLDGIREHDLPRAVAGAIADDLLITSYRLPFGPGDFIRWAIENGHLDYE
jgi:predicted nucleic acid-binding protein